MAGVSPVRVDVEKFPEILKELQHQHEAVYFRHYPRAPSHLGQIQKHCHIEFYGEIEYGHHKNLSIQSHYTIGQFNGLGGPRNRVVVAV